MAVSRTEGGLGLMSCVRESSPSDAVDADPTTHETKKRRFHPLRGLRRMFRRKGRRRAPQTVSADELSDPQPCQDHQADRRRSGSVLHTGLSLSHDSVFSPGPEAAHTDPDTTTSATLSVHRLASTNVQAELVDAVRRRRQRDDTSDDEDLGLPHSPASDSPTNTAGDHDAHLKEIVNKSNQSTCSDGSLLSVGSSEMDEDSYGQSSGHGSKLSLHEKKVETTDVEVTSAPLSHSAARHKMAIKPKRTHGVPRKRKSTQLAEVTMLPATPEVNEESNSNSVSNGRSVTPELPPATGSVSTAQLKSASLPPGTSPAWPTSPPATRLSRSRSSATAAEPTDQDTTTTADTTDPIATTTADHSGSTFFGRLLSRRSGKKKKNPQDKEPPLEIPQKRMDEKGRYVHEVTKLGRHHPASRQRVEPINLSQDRSISRTQVFYPPSPPPPDSPRMRHREVIDVVSDDENTLEGRTSLKKIIPLEVDSSIPKRTFVKKSHSFRRDEALPFVSLDTPSLPVGLGVDLQKDAVEDLNELTTMEVMDQHVMSDKVQSYISEATTTTTVMINSKEEPDSCKVTVTAESPRENVESPVKKSISLDSIHSRELDHSSKKSASSENIIHHQVTIPINPSIVNISQVTSEPQPAVSPTHNVKPEPRKSLKEGNKELPPYHPIPAPRPSKRDSLEAKPPRVPEFLRVQLNHVDSKPAVNVVLSTVSNSTEGKSPEQCEQVTEIETTKDETAKGTQSLLCKISKTDEIGDSKLDVYKEETKEMKKQEVCVLKESIDPNQVKFINSVKQWSAATVSANPNYSIVSIAPRAPETKKSPEKPVILTNQSVHKTVIIKEVKEKSSPLVEKNQDVPPLKPVLRQRSFVSEEKPANILNNDKFSKADDVKVTPRKKSLPKEVLISDIDRSRKLSLEKLDSRNQENISEFKRKSREMSSSEDNIVDRNSYGSSDTLASQDSGEVVLRRKSLSREIMKQKDEEPELLKVFARRSLKVKDCDAPDDLDTPPTKSRDSDKENECGDSPPEERKKIKEHLSETKQSEKIVPSVVALKYQRSVSANNDDTVSTSVLANSKKDNNSYEKRQRSRTIPDPKIMDPPSSIVSHKDRLACIFVEKEVEVISLEKPEEDNRKEENVPSFKRIQQRKEEWEKRAQLAMKNNLP